MDVACGVVARDRWEENRWEGDIAQGLAGWRSRAGDMTAGLHALGSGMVHAGVRGRVPVCTWMLLGD